MDIRETGSPGTSRHPWEVAKARAVRRILQPALNGYAEPVHALDIGCGDGYIAQSIFGADGPFKGVVDGVDVLLTKEKLATMPIPPGFQYHSTFDEIAGKRFNLALALDVLEHQKDDNAFIAEIFGKWLSPGGKALITVPAFDNMFSNHDRFLGHYRRYSLGALELVINQAPCRIISKGYLFASLLPVKVISLAVERITGRERRWAEQYAVGSWRGGELATSIVAGAMDMDNAALLWLARRNITLPGLSAWALCEKAG